WYYHGPVREGSSALERILAGPDGDPALRAHALRAAARLAAQYGDLDHATELHGESLRLWRQLDARYEIAVELINLSSCACDAGDYEAIQRHLDEALPLARELGQVSLHAMALINLAVVPQVAGDYKTARAYYE